MMTNNKGINNKKFQINSFSKEKIYNHTLYMIKSMDEKRKRNKPTM